MAESAYESEIFTLTDEDGVESDFELIGSMEIDGNTYVALVPVEDNENGEYVILKVECDDEGEETLITIEDDDEFDKVADAFEDEFIAEFDYDENTESIVSNENN